MGPVARRGDSESVGQTVHVKVNTTAGSISVITAAGAVTSDKNWGKDSAGVEWIVWRKRSDLWV